jgi:hypothetical protein
MADGRNANPATRRNRLIGYVSADINTIRARRTSECGKLREREIAPNCSASAALTVTAVLGLPMAHHNSCSRLSD